MNILVTGANGYLGRGIVRELLKQGHEVTALDLKVDSVDEKAKKFEINLFELEQFRRFLKNTDVVLHLAWRDGFIHYSDAHIDDLPKHYELVKCICDSNVKKLCIMGSVHEIGFYEGSIDESTPCNPVTPYGISKNALRQLSENLCKIKNKEFQWLRGFYIVGTTLNGSSIFSKISLAEKKEEREFPFTMGLNQFDFIDYEDFCRKVACAVSQDKVEGIINVCSGRPEKLSDRVERFIKENGFKIKLKYGSFPERPYDSKAIWGNDDKIKEIMAIVGDGGDTML